MTERKGINVLTADIKAQKVAGDTYDIVLSMPTKDRDGEIIDARAFEPLPNGRLPIDVDHGMTVLTTVGSGIPEYDGDVLVLRDFRFASIPLAQDVKVLVDEGHISKMSVAFMDAFREVDENDGLPHVRSAELLNAAIVAIPSNRESEIAFAQKSALKADPKSVAVCETCGQPPADTDPEQDAAADEAAAESPAEVDVARAMTELARVEADLALE